MKFKQFINPAAGNLNQDFLKSQNITDRPGETHFIDLKRPDIPSFIDINPFIFREKLILRQEPHSGGCSICQDKLKPQTSWYLDAGVGFEDDSSPLCDRCGTVLYESRTFFDMHCNFLILMRDFAADEYGVLPPRPAEKKDF